MFLKYVKLKAVKAIYFFIFLFWARARSDILGPNATLTER